MAGLVRLRLDTLVLLEVISPGLERSIRRLRE